MIEGIKTYGNNSLINELKYAIDPVFICTIGTTETSLIPGLSGAGASPDLTEYTPAADVEILCLGNVKCMDNIPQTVVGKAAAPTPAMLTKASLQIADIPFVIVDAGSKIKPQIECMRMGSKYGRDIRTGKGVLNPLEIYENARDLGAELARRHPMLIIGESIAAGTTTALGVLRALGYDANEKVSGSMPNNPHDMKTKIVDEGLKNANLDPKKDNIDGLQAVGAVGDPILAAVSGLVIGVDEQIPIILAGGTQMAAVCAIIKSIKPNFDFSRINIATTVYVVGDETADLIGLLSQIDEDITLHSVDPHFEESEHDGLKNYLDGFVKEGAGAGGAMFTALVRGVPDEKLRKKIETVCK